MPNLALCLSLLSELVFTVAYLANEFPVAVEPYVGEEIEELRRRGIAVIGGSVRKSHTMVNPSSCTDAEVIRIQPIQVLILVRALGLLLSRRRRISDLITRVLLRGRESPKLRAKALLHTWLGAYYAVQLKGSRPDHIHAHHGYFGSWIAMVAARLLGVSFSLTLHGSDLLLGGAYLDSKLQDCQFCLTISEYNRRYILQNFPAIPPKKIVVSRLGVDVPMGGQFFRSSVSARGIRHVFHLLAVGRLHTVKDHAFLVRACARLDSCGINFECAIAGDGPERRNLELLIRRYRLQHRIILLGHVDRRRLDSLYHGADVVVLTSRSEGIPLVLMEAMARGKVVLAPAITGVPELVIPGKTGFLYAPGSMNDFVATILFIEQGIRGETQTAVSRMDWIRHAARLQVTHNFNRSENLARFARLFPQLASAQHFADQDRRSLYEDFVLQQI